MLIAMLKGSKCVKDIYTSIRLKTKILRSRKLAGVSYLDSVVGLYTL